MRVKVNRFSIEYNFYDASTGVPLVFVHGFPFNQKMWSPQVEFFKNRFPILTYDIRGLGESDVGDGQYMFENLVDDFIELVKILKLDRVVACGLSMGGYILFRAYEKKPDIFHALIFADTKPGADGNEAKLKRSEHLHILKYHGVEKFTDEFLKLVLSEKTLNEKPDVVNFVKNMIQSNDPKGIAGVLIALATRLDTSEVPQKIEVPSLIITGELDTLTPPDTARELGSKIKNSKVEIIPSAGHLSNIENPDKFNTALESFLGFIF